MMQRWYINELVRAVIFGTIWSIVFYLTGQQLAWHSGIAVGVVWFLIAGIYYRLGGSSSSIKAVLLSLMAAALFFVVWIVAVLYTGGDVANGLIIGFITAALFGIGYYLFIYFLPTRSNRRQ